MAKLVIGIDFSKETMNYCCLSGETRDVLIDGKVENSIKGCNEMVRAIRSIRKGLRVGDFLFCGERTGMYSIEVAQCLSSRKYLIWLENPLQIKLSSGMRRGKNDAMDARMIAEYAFRFQDKAVCYEPCSLALKKLRELHIVRRQLKRCETAISNLSHSLRKESSAAKNAIDDVLTSLKQAVKKLEKEIHSLLTQDQELSKNAGLAVSVPGISWVIASAIIIDTENFTRFTDARRYANHTGCVPHEYSSGTSVHKRPHVSKASNRYINSLLTQGVVSIMANNAQTKIYVEKKRKEGKPTGFIINNIRNKTIHRLFAVIKSGEAFTWDYKKSDTKNNS